MLLKYQLVSELLIKGLIWDQKLPGIQHKHHKHKHIVSCSGSMALRPIVIVFDVKRIILVENFHEELETKGQDFLGQDILYIQFFSQEKSYLVIYNLHS